MSLNIVILDGALANPGDLSWDKIESLGSLTVYQQTDPDQVIERSQDADVLITNKIILDKSHFEQLPKLKLICLLATGYNNINIVDAHQANITVCNAVGYAVDSVAQHVFSLLLHIRNQVAAHNDSIQKGDWYKSQWSYSLVPINGLAQKTLGIYGMGKIGAKVAEVAHAFGMNVLATSRSERPMKDVNYVSIDELFSKSDVVSLHAPLTSANEGIVNAKLLCTMKQDAILINTARGGHIVEEDLRSHLLINPDSYAALDVLSQEPPCEGHPLIGLSNCILTPHNAWANVDARRRLLEIVFENIKGFETGNVQNAVQS